MSPYRLPFILILTLFTLHSFSQQPKTYEKQWKTVDSLVNKNLPKSALTEVKKIYQLAKTDKQDAQQIKALIYITGLQQENQENNEEKTIAEFEKEIATATQPSKSILNSLLAGLYWQYFQTHRWKFYDRTKTVNFKKDDIATWSAEDFVKKTTELYLHSIENENLLKSTKLDAYDAIILNGNMRHLRPTLFDLLAHRALDYFKSDETDITKPAYVFEIDQSSAFAPAAEFIKEKFPTRDSISLQQTALLLFQKLIAFHLNDAKPDALIDVDLERIEFINEKGVQPGKKELYLAALHNLINRNENNSAADQAWYLIANQYKEDGSNWEPYGDTALRYDKLRAKEICEKIVAKKDSSEGKVNCYNLLSELIKKSLAFQIEKVNLPNQSFRCLVSYKNFDKLQLRMIKVDDALKNTLPNYFNEDAWKKIIALKSLKDWEQQLPTTNDLQEHSVEIKIDPLPAGDYLLLAGTEKDFKSKATLLAANLFYVSSISFVKNNRDVFVLHRETGQPLANASVQTLDRIYDYKTSTYKNENSKLYATDKNGYLKLTGKNNNEDYFDISYAGERLFMDEEVGGYNFNFNETPPKPPGSIDKNITIFFFTDRSIYRPGQTVFFKGIAVTKDKENKSVIKPEYETMVYLRDANYQFIDSMKLKTSDYGSFSGKFQLRQSGLNGRFSIVTKQTRSEVDFSVEEYKRPKFYIDYEKLKGTYKVNDKIKITGLAKAYAGNNIDNATVKYRVVRRPRFIYDWYFWRWWQPATTEMEIVHGETKTDKDGKYEIEFTAIPDLTIDKKIDPVFDYNVYSDVTDINGETRGGEQIVSVSYKSLLLSVSLADKLPIDSLKEISISTTNLAGEFVRSQVTVTISKLKEENRLIRERYWKRPDQFVMNKEEYISNFPNDEYDNESDFKSWEKQQKVSEITNTPDSNTKFPITNSKLLPGFYVIEISTKDKDGNEVKDIKYLELFEENSQRLNHPQYLWRNPGHLIEPGQKTGIGIGTATNDAFIIQSIEKMNGSNPRSTNQSFSFIKLNNEKKTLDFTATEADRGGYGVSYFFVKNNRFHQFNDVINVPWTNKQLKIEFASFRDKTLPGSEEQWKVKISGHKGEKIAAEILASMYDASLDQFKFHQWNLPIAWYDFNRYDYWDDRNFAAGESKNKEDDIGVRKDLNKEYDRIFSDEFGDFFGPEIKLMKITPGMQLDRSAVVFNFKTTKGLDSATFNISSPITIVSKTPVISQENFPNQIRKNFNETAFFFPDLHTDSTGAIEFSFTVPEALTKWKLQTLAHTKDLAFGYSSKELITQKKLMVQPNAPRFLREGDKIEFTSKIVNLGDSEMTGQAELQLIDAETNQSVNGWFQNVFPNQYFTVAAGQSEVVKFPIDIPFLYNKPLVWRIIARSGDISDGEENMLPVLSNKTLVTESMPLNVRGSGTKHFKFEKLLNAGESETMEQQGVTVEFTANPAWYAVQALPYLIEFPYECAEQTWNRFYANSLASMIANSSPRIKDIFQQWSTKDTSALLSNLQMNQELKSVLLEETPWVLDAKSEEQQKKNISLLFDLVKMSDGLNSSLEKLKQMQSPNGGFIWFQGGPDNRYITQYIVTAIGHLRKLNAMAKGQEEKLKSIYSAALPYLDIKIKRVYDDLVKSKTNLTTYTPWCTEIQYLYMRSFFRDYPIAKESQTAVTYFINQSKKYWTSQSKFMQGMIALIASRNGDAKTANDILKSLKQTAVVNDELGMYWKANGGWYWYEAPIERQALLIEAFQEISKDDKTVDDLKTWLLKNKQTQNWGTTKATAEACYALLIQGSQWLNAEPTVEIKLGNTTISSQQENKEAGTGYFKKIIEGSKVTPEMGDISVQVDNRQLATGNQQGATSWGAVYWQYFEEMDKITSAATPLSLTKKLFVEKNTDNGPVITPVNDGDELKIGDKIKVRIELRADRDMEYVHMKDMRASCMEPTNVLSEYKWQGGLGYYESTKDASTNFFFDELRKGTYVFEYTLFVTHAGNFSNGITTIQCMYAPEFNSHSEGVRVSVVE